MALNGLQCADVPLRNYSLTHPARIAAEVHGIYMKPRHKVVNKKWFTNKLQHSACMDSRWLLSESTSVSIHADRLIYWRSLWWSTSGTRSDVCVRVRTKLLNRMNPKIWNSLPQLLECVPALTLFCRNLETHVFHNPSFLYLDSPSADHCARL